MYLKVLCYVSVLLSWCSARRFENLGALINALGWKHIIFYNTEKTAEFPKIATAKMLLANNIAMTHVKDLNHCWSYEAKGVVLANPTDLRDNKEYFKMLRCSEPYSFIIHFVNSTTLLIEEILANINVSSSFFSSFLLGDGNISLHRTQTFRSQNKFALDLVEQTNETLTIKYNLNGALMRGVNLPWMPYIDLTGCNEQGQNCNMNGIFKDIFVLLQNIFNFTLIVDKEPTNTWGKLVFEEGCDDRDGKEAMAQRIRKREYDISIGPWGENFERAQCFDFTVAAYGRERRLALNFNKSPIGFTLFIRPFTPITWIFVSCIQSCCQV